MNDSKAKVYRCDPEKNKTCPKTACGVECFHTLDPAYAVDGDQGETMEEILAKVDA